MLDVKFIAARDEGTSRPCRQIDRMFRRANAEFKVALECSTMDFACRLVAAGVGALLAPQLHIDDLLRPHLRILPFTPEISVDVAVVHPRRRPPGLLARRFIDALGATLGNAAR